MNTDEIETKVKDFFNKAKNAGKSAMDKAGNKVQDFSDKSVVRLEKRKLESNLEKKYSDFGKKCYELLKNDAVTIQNSEEFQTVTAQKKEIEDLLLQIQQKEDLLK